MKHKLEVLSNVVFIAVALVIAGLFVKGYVRSEQAENSRGSGLLRVNDTLPRIPGYKWSSHRLTLLLALRSGCHFCDASMPFYRRLASLQSENRSSAHLLAVLPDERSVANALLVRNGFVVQLIPEIPLQTLGVSGTPTVILVDLGGKVLDYWVGQLPQARETEILSRITVAPVKSNAQLNDRRLLTWTPSKHFG